MAADGGCILSIDMCHVIYTYTFFITQKDLEMFKMIMGAFWRAWPPQDRVLFLVLSSLFLWCELF